MKWIPLTKEITPTSVSVTNIMEVRDRGILVHTSTAASRGAPTGGSAAVAEALVYVPDATPRNFGLVWSEEEDRWKAPE